MATVNSMSMNSASAITLPWPNVLRPLQIILVVSKSYRDHHALDHDIEILALAETNARGFIASASKVSAEAAKRFSDKVFRLAAHPIPRVINPVNPASNFAMEATTFGSL